MPYIQCDAKSLEVFCGAYLSQDEILMNELRGGLDIHALNQREVLHLEHLEDGRLIAKIFIFRLMYGGSAYSYAHDSDFIGVSSKEAFWQEIIDNFYMKYKGFMRWHNKILQDACRDGFLIMPTGRVYDFKMVRNFRGELEPPQTIIKNYPVQGLGADIMAIARILFWKKFKESKIIGKLCNTVHDSIVVDAPTSEMQRISNTFHEVFSELPSAFQKVFGVEFNLPLKCEVLAGPNLADLQPLQ